MDRTGRLLLKTGLLLLILAGMLLSGVCAHASEAGTMVGISLPSSELQRWNADGAAFRSELQAAGYTVDVRYASNRAEQQISQIKSMIDNGCSVIVITPVGGYELRDVLYEAEEKGIKIIAYDRLIMESDAVDYYVTFSNYEVGKLQGTYIRSMLQLDSAPGPFNIEFTAGDPSDNNGYLFYNGAMDVLKPYIDSGKLIVKSGQKNFSEVTTDWWSSDNAQSRAATILANYYADGSTLDAWLCSNDSTAIGVIRALEYSDYRNKWPVITGQDADLPNVRYMLVGKQAMSVYKQISTIRSQAIKMVKQILQGTTVETNTTEHNGARFVPTYSCKPIYITKGNYKELLIDTGVYTEADFTNLPSPPPENEPEPGVIINGQSFPDAVFMDYVKRFDTNGNGSLSRNEINAVTNITVKNLGIQSLEGIEFFTELTYLECRGNNLASLNVRENSVLEYLDCSDNLLTSLDISNNTELTHLLCSGNRLMSLDLGANTKLEAVWCFGNQLTSLNVDGAESLVGLTCYGNQLTKLDIRKCPGLARLVSEVEPIKEDMITWLMEENDIAKSWLYTDSTVDVITEDGSGEKIEAYVTRCYEIILGREPDAGGLDTWFNELNSGRKAAAEIIDRFVNSNEFLGKNYSNEEAVDILYRTMLGRSADPAGKANWVSKLESGQTLAHVINGFCFSKEFRGLCDNYGIRAGFVNIENTDPTPEGKIKAFIQRCYRIILDREADPSGMQTWYEQLSSGKKVAAEIIDRFVNSPEFSGKNYSHSDSVEILYKAMLGRGSDAAGKANWVYKLDVGQPFAVVINGFCVSKEFTGICAAYGIRPGSVDVLVSGQSEEELSKLALNAKEPIARRSETKPNRVEIINPSDTIDLNIGTAVQAVYINDEKAKEYISRCYRVILGREANEAELNSWIGQMVNGTKTPDQIARGFLFSDEFKAKSVSNEDLVKILYKVYMNREADPEGLATWTGKLDNGTALKDLLDAFAKTSEFKKVVSEMGR